MEEEPAFMGPGEHLSAINYSSWLQQWHKQLPLTIHVPQEACSIVSPFQPAVWEKYLAKYPNHQLVEFFLQGLSEGFHTGFDYTSITFKSAKSNMKSTSSHADVVEEYLKIEIKLGRVAGPFLPEVIQNGHISRFGVIPKNHQPNKWCQLLICPIQPVIVLTMGSHLPYVPCIM